MATNEDFEKTPSFSHLLDDVMGVGSFTYQSPSMLCFETNTHKYRVNGGVGCGGGGDSLSASSSNSSSSSSITKSKRNSGQGNTKSLGLGSVESKKTSKRAKTENPTSKKSVKVRKEKLGERITALQQLVSPFGKTDTASVLHEAMGYIRFLHDQVQVLSSPYLQGMPSSTHLITDGRGEVEREGTCDLRSRGLCLVPVECMVHVGRSNGADYWSPAMGNNTSRH